MNLRVEAIAGLFWTFTQQFSVQLISFIVQIILARLLLPEEFGLIAMLTVFIAVGQMLMDGGMTTSIIRTKDPDQLDYSTVFVTNVIISLLIYGVIFLISPFIGAFYEQNILEPIIKVYALTFVIRSLIAVQVAKLTKEMNFKLQMKLQIPSTIVSAFVGISMAYAGFGVWSLVWLNLAQSIALVIQYWAFVKWKPSLRFDKQRFRYHFKFGYKMTLSGLLDTIYTNSYHIVIGKFFSPTSVGFYSQAESMRLLPVAQLSSVLGKVTFPLFSKLQNDEQLKSAYRTSMRLVLFTIIPIMLCLIIVSEEFFLLLFGEKWLPAVPYFQILCIASIVRPVSTYNLNILKVKGRSDLFLKLEVIKKAIGIIAIAIAIPFGISGLVWSNVIIAIFSLIINMVYSGRQIKYFYYEQLKDLASIFIVGIVTGVLCWFLHHNLISTLVHNYFVRLLVSVSVFLSLYGMLSYFFKIQALNYIITLLIRKKDV